MKRTLRRVWRRIDNFWWYWCRNFPRRIWLYRKWLAHDNDFDWSPMAEIMEIKLRRMAKVFENGLRVRSDMSARECRVAAHILHRLIEENYSSLALRNGVAHDECKLLGKLIGRKMRCWWD